MITKALFFVLKDRQTRTGNGNEWMVAKASGMRAKSKQVGASCTRPICQPKAFLILYVNLLPVPSLPVLFQSSINFDNQLTDNFKADGMYVTADFSSVCLLRSPLSSNFGTPSPGALAIQRLEISCG